jgi:hypothetical protein
VALPFTLKKHLKTKEEESWKLKYFTMQKIQSSKSPLKKNQNPSRYHKSITNLKFQHKPKKYHLSKNSHIKIDLLLLLLPRGQAKIN